MKITNLKLLNFRNYENLTLNFGNHTNIIYGQNGMGKTNIVEAIYLLALTKSFRLGAEEVVIKKGKNLAKVEGVVDETTYKIIISPDGKRLKINNNNLAKTSDYAARIFVILFHHDDLKIIKDTPMTRRRLLNIDISSINNEYILYLNNYNKVLKQRNSYLKALNKKGQSSNEFLNILTEQLINIGLKIVDIRSNFIASINNYITDIYYQITNKGPLTVHYKSEFLNKSPKQLLQMYQKNISREIFLGKTIFGVQHDDIEFLIGEEIVREYSSVGEQKNSVIAFKLAEIKNIEDTLNKEPILILDDLFSELDQEKINNILTLLDKKLQTFITTTEISNVDKSLLINSKIFQVINGEVLEVKNGK